MVLIEQNYVDLYLVMRQVGRGGSGCCGCHRRQRVLVGRQRLLLLQLEVKAHVGHGRNEAWN